MRAILYTTLALLFFAAVPWFFAEGSEERLFGLPAWALYSLAMSVLYACVISFFVSRFWDNGDDAADDADKPEE